MLMLQLISIYKPSLPPLHSHFLQWEESVEAINCLLWIENINKPHITQLLSKWQTCIIILYCLTRGLLMSNLCLNTNWAPLNAWSTILVGIESAFNYLRSVPKGKHYKTSPRQRCRIELLYQNFLEMANSPLLMSHKNLRPS